MNLPNIIRLLFLSLSLLAFCNASETEETRVANTVTDVKATDTPFDVRDKYRRSTPHSSFENFMRYAKAHNFKEAANYLDINSLRIEPTEALTNEEWARQVFIVLDSLFADTPTLSNLTEGDYQDGLPASLEWVGDAKVGDQFIEILMKKVGLSDGQEVWLIAANTLEELPLLYERYGQKNWERWLDDHFGGTRVLDIELWLWTIFITIGSVLITASALAARLVGRVIVLKDKEYNRAFRRLIRGPVALVIGIELSRIFLHNISLNATLIKWFETAPITTLAYAWLISRLLQFAYIYNQRRLIRLDRNVTAVLMRPLLTVIRIAWFTVTFVYIFHRAGFNISTMIAGLGIGGMAIALASQDTLKNVFGSLMILGDKPFSVGQRILANGFDGVVEEIGIRSTKIRLLNGHQASIPNDTISRAEIENVGRRPFIRNSSALLLPLDTPAEKLEQAVKIVSDLLEDHEGFDAAFPPRIHLNGLTETGYRLKILFWYHPPEYWEYQAYCQQFNLNIAKSFADAGIRLAAPARDIYLRSGSSDTQTTEPTAG